ncbi:unnamed protein product [Nyctereutes procyonoides]|uniref:(raccoon dog) hypothetical protein n=1 Tax=Nyctereutes procyonoides TaxID=34880 RepID=A0A811YGB7_NYCPR|nr:unnamed protein product [Nyctereutes procyonoides]
MIPWSWDRSLYNRNLTHCAQPQSSPFPVILCMSPCKKLRPLCGAS